MFLAVGIETETVYASGSRAECLQALNEKFPSYLYKKSNLKISKGALGSNILPEPIKIKKERK